MSLTRPFDPIVRLFWEGEHPPRWREPGRLLYDCELVLVSAGEAQMTMGRSGYVLRPGSVIVIPPGTWHETRVEAHAVRHCVHFDWTPEHAALVSPLQVPGLPEYRPELEHTPPAWVRARMPLCRTLHAPEMELALELIAALRQQKPVAGLRLWPLLRCLLTEADAPAASAVGNKSAQAALTVKHLIESRFAEPLDYADFCALTRLSRCHLCAVFSRLVGMAPAAYLNHVRLEAAARMLLEGGRNIAQTGRVCGIADANYFARLFRKKFGCSPQEYLQQAAVEVAAPAMRRGREAGRGQRLGRRG